ncbi:MAG: hypothetical protein V4548_12100 [Bacteroidota bacterium]
MINLLSKIIQLNNINVVGLIKNDNGESYNVLTVKKKGNKIDIVSMASFDTFEALSNNEEARKLPMLLVIDGKGVLNKEIDFNNEADVLWQKNIDFSTIYHTSLKGFKSSFISFCRKNVVEDSILKFRKNGFQVVDIYIGSFLSALLYSSINKEAICSNDLVLEFENGLLSNFTKGDAIKREEYVIGKDNVSNVFLPLYGAVIHFFVQPKEVSKTKDETLNVEEIIYKKAFTVFGITMLAGFLIALLSSYLLIQYYGSKNAELNLQNVYSNQSYQLILDLEKQKENKQNILRESGFLSSKFLSYYGYEIIRNIPQDITLTGLNIIPLIKETKAEKKMGFETKTILVKGETFNEASFNRWMESLKKMKWMDHFEIIGLKKDKKNKSQFEIKITIKDV